MAAVRGFALPIRALKALGLPSNASLDDARRAHRVLARQLHPDLENSRYLEEGCSIRRTEQLVVANAAREAIEAAVKDGMASTTWTKDMRLQWDIESKKIHVSAMLGQWEELLETLCCGVDPNILTPAQGAPPIFYASCCPFLGRKDVGLGDEGRLRVLEILASNPKVQLSLQGRTMWAEGRTIFDLVAMGRCSEAARERLERGREAMSRMLGVEENFSVHPWTLTE